MINDPETPDVGVIPTESGRADWRVWASKAKAVELVIDPGGRAERLAMTPEGRGYFRVRTAEPGQGLRYGYSLDGGPVLPDPASRWQPDGVNGPSAVYFPERFAWDEAGWTGVGRADLVFYELHVGTFTPEGTFDSVIPRLDALKELGVTAVELMPVNQFPGTRSWGYDGVLLFAAQNSYGGPEGLQRLVQACHRRGLAVTLDVVFNHFGTESNHGQSYADYLTEAHKTDWGPAVNFDARCCDPVRSFFLQNVRMWVRDFHIDALRVDAADQIVDRGPRHVLADLADVAHDAARANGREAFVFAETDLNDAPRFLRPDDRGGYGFDGHWNDDFHHAAHNVLTGEHNGYYVDFAAGPKALAKAFERVFVNDGNYSEFRGRRHGTPAVEFPGDRFVAFTQNHDQVGNRVKSDRYAASLPPQHARLAAGLLLLAPRLPLLFMGEEYGETNPFPYFSDFQSPELIEAIRKGRKAEFSYFGWDGELRDPFDPETRAAAVPSWDWSSPVRGGLRSLYATLLRLRKSEAGLRDPSHARTRLIGADVLEIVRGADGPSPVTVLFNLSDEAREVPTEFAARTPTLRSESPEFGAEFAPVAAKLRPREFVVYGEGSVAPR